jgi:hypothetical protein
VLDFGVLECWSCGDGVGGYGGFVRWGVVGVLFGFGGGDAPTTFLVAYGGDGVQLWRWLGVWWLCLGWWCLTELVTWWGFGRVSFSGLELLRW